MMQESEGADTYQTNVVVSGTPGIVTLETGKVTLFDHGI